MRAICFLVCFGVVFVNCLPTVYKYNENKVLEPDLVPVSSTVIPLPVYQVGYGINVPSTNKNSNAKKPDEPIQLLTVHTKKKHIPEPKKKHNEYSTVKEISKKDYEFRQN